MVALTQSGRRAENRLTEQLSVSVPAKIAEALDRFQASRHIFSRKEALRQLLGDALARAAAAPDPECVETVEIQASFTPAALDALRRAVPDALTYSEAVRRLAAQALRDQGLI